MNEHFDRAPGAGRGTLKADGPLEGGDAARFTFSQREPLRQPRTSPSLLESSCPAGPGDSRPPHPDQIPASDGTLAIGSTLSAEAKEFYPLSYTLVQEPGQEDDSGSYYSGEWLAELVQEFVGQLEASPGTFDLDMENFTATLNECITTEETLQELATSIPNFAYTGARLCNYLSHHLAISPSSGNFRQLLLKRCHTEYKARDEAMKGNEEVQKAFHSYVLFLGELYLNLEIRGSQKRAMVLLPALKDLVHTLLNNPVDGNLVCIVKLLKLTGSVLEDDWKENGETTMDDLITKIRSIQLDVSCSRDVKEMLLSLLELRSSNWGRVYSGSAVVEATPDNDPNYFMNEPTFYTADGTPFTAADPEYSEHYQDILDREAYCPDVCEENGTEGYYEEEDEMDPEMVEAYEKFCLESEEAMRRRRQ
ncbi:polyadenylate-binding protein-interacting protein 1 isoform X2 [Brienomyrus brachyistius]|uniref:polyadenylate-binding protein-interacting protein 1 isoform X2 n=1 Tax=Brienomyrus brachyistius TaxID=42636 RepID=UPI0020B17B48|nr:polyadenylate-binding protein-interacting protein 1 isoform X2 [Brienomyrus brachyistius]